MRLILFLLALVVVVAKNCTNNCDCATSDCVNRECVNGTCNENINCTQCGTRQFYFCYNGVAHCENKPTWG